MLPLLVGLLSCAIMLINASVVFAAQSGEAKIAALDSLPATERQADRIITLPVNQYMTSSDVEIVATEILRFFKS